MLGIDTLYTTETRQKRVIVPIPEKCFDAREAMLTLFDARGKLTRDEKKDCIRKIKNTLHEQIQGIAAMLAQIFQTFQTKKSVRFGEIMDYVEKKAKEFNLNENQIAKLVEALKIIKKRLETIEQKKDLVRHPQLLYEMCFEKEPTGEVRADIIGICVRMILADVRDFVYADYGANADSPEEWKRRITDAADGIALPSVEIPNMENIFFVENAGKMLLRGKKTSVLPIDNLVVHISHKTRWYIERVPGAVWIKNNNGFEMRADYWMTEEPEEWKITSMVQKNKRTKTQVLKDGVEIILRANGIQLQLTRNGKVIIFNENNQSINVSSDMSDPPINPVTVHELVHQFNTLHNPKNGYMPIQELIRTVKEDMPKMEPSQQLKRVRKLIKDIAGVIRADTVDVRVRDEIIAYYMDGTKTNEIPERLYETPHYPYMRLDDETEIQKLIITIKSLLTIENIKGAFPSKVREIILSVFNNELKKNLNEWMECITQLETILQTNPMCKIDRTKLTGLLYQYPVSQWKTLVRRMKQSINHPQTLARILQKTLPENNGGSVFHDILCNTMRQ